jgi:hypothetical protein
MQTTHLVRLIDESIRLELNAAALYRMFSESIKADSRFWWQLHLEEKSHASLLRAGKESFVKRGKFPSAITADSIEKLEQANKDVETLISKYNDSPPARNEACQIALRLENGTGEIHFMQFMEKDAESPVEMVFQQLNRSDKNHVQRIEQHLASLSADN